MTCNKYAIQSSGKCAARKSINLPMIDAKLLHCSRCFRRVMISKLLSLSQTYNTTFSDLPMQIDGKHTFLHSMRMILRYASEYDDFGEMLEIKPFLRTSQRLMADFESNICN